MVMASQPWSLATRDAAVQRGPHKSAHDHREFVVFEEILDFCAQGYWAVLPCSHVRDWPGLRVSPLGVVPQRDRRPRLIVDYSFSNVNADTVPLAPNEAMQFGRALNRVVRKIVRADPRYGPTYLAKIDIADGFYRVWLQLQDIVLKLGVILPTSPGQPPLVAFPLALPMGWIESPPYFCALTETACDLSNNHLRCRPRERPRSTVHRLEAVAATLPPTPLTLRPLGGWPLSSSAPAQTQARPPTAAVDVYVDDFLLLAQTKHHQREVLRSALCAIDAVFKPLAPDDRHTGKSRPQ